MLRRIRNLAADRSGLAAVEFALIAPVMIMMFYGAVELSSAVDCHSRVTHVAATTADLIAQSQAVSSADVTNVFSAANSILYPFSSDPPPATPSNPHPNSPVRIVVSSLVDDGNGGTTVAWSNASDGVGRTVGSHVVIPAGLVEKGSGGSVIFAEVTYDYYPPVTYYLDHKVTFYDVFYSRPRRSLTVAHT